MKTPKIGDIVWFYSEEDIKHPAIILDRWDDSHVYLKIFDDEAEKWTDESYYSATPKEDHWSWPEEEKPKEKPKECTHNYQDEFLLKCPPLLQKVCQKCRHVREEKQEECEHDWKGEDSTLKQMVCWDCGAKFPMQKPESKAEELIEKIWEIIDGGSRGEYNPSSKLYATHNLLREYKGITHSG